MDKKEILNQINIVSLVQNYLDLKKTGNNYVGLCPFHSDTKPSLIVSESKQIFKCFACNTGGNAIKFCMLFENCGFKKAIISICQQFNIELSTEWKSSMQISKKIENITNINNEAKIFFQFNLINGSEVKALQYCQNRRITSQIIKQFQIGWADNDDAKLWKYLQEKKNTDIEILNSDLFQLNIKDKPISYFKKRLIFPVENEDGYVVGFVGRVIEDSTTSDQPKYLNSKESKTFNKSQSLYNLYYVKKHFKGVQELYLVEGLLDSIQLIMNKYPAIALMGTNLSQHQSNMIRDYCTKVIIFPDNDLAGKTSTIKNSLILLKNKINVTIVDQNQGKDADKCLQITGFDLNKIIKIHPLEFIINQYPSTIDSNQTVELINEIKSFGDYVNEVQMIKIKEKIKIKYSLPPYLLDNFNKKPHQNQVSNINLGKPKTKEWKEILFAKLLYHPEIIKQMIEIKGTFNDLEYDFFYHKLVKWYNSKVQFGKLFFSDFLTNLDKNERQKMIEIYKRNMNKEEVIDGNPEFTKDCIKKFKIENLNLQINNLKKKIEKNNDSKLLLEIKYLVVTKNKLMNQKK